MSATEAPARRCLACGNTELMASRTSLYDAFYPVFEDRRPFRTWWPLQSFACSRCGLVMRYVPADMLAKLQDAGG